MRIVILGAGNIATTLAPALARVGHEIAQVYSRTLHSCLILNQRLQTAGQEPLLTNSLTDIITDADLYVYALPDDVIPDVASLLKTNSRSVHLLVAGTVSLSVFDSKQRKAVMYPFQSFSRQKEVDLRGVPMLIEAGDDETLREVKQLAQQLSDKVFEANLEERCRLHLAGVLVNNFTNHLYNIAKQQLDRANLPFDLLLPLIDYTAQKVHQMTPEQAQTGPAVRHDEHTIGINMSLLDNPTHRQLYQLFTQDIQE